MVFGLRTVTPLLPAQTGTLRGAAFTLWLPPSPAPPARAGVVVVHGADSCKESHHGFARAAVAVGLAVICFDQRGHGETGGRLDGGAIDDVLMFVVHLRGVLGDRTAPVALRGSSMGGYLALVAAADGVARGVPTQAVVAICPASADGLRRGLEEEDRFSFAADRDALRALLDAHDLTAAAGELTIPVLLMHAEGDERVPIAHSRELAEVLTAPGSRLIAVPGGHHRSIQHDEELQAVSLRFIRRALEPGPAGG
ncbi:MAG TPA: alpha/beta fold hydrolase [Solirubrobacteraceae bacterium]|nr:alpha/beta fold hydrolase [Solirubrobacteraceae bacterium]